MDKNFLSLLIGISLFFALLHGGVFPVFQKLSKALQGEPFTYQLQVWMKSQSSEKVAKRDILWSAASLMIAMASTLGILMLLPTFGVTPKE